MAEKLGKRFIQSREDLHPEELTAILVRKESFVTSTGVQVGRFQRAVFSALEYNGHQHEVDLAALADSLFGTNGSTKEKR